MDFAIGTVPSGANTSFEGWNMANAPNALAPAGYVCDSHSMYFAVRLGAHAGQLLARRRDRPG
jgi:hypothetical protein